MYRQCKCAALQRCAAALRCNRDRRAAHISTVSLIVLRYHQLHQCSRHSDAAMLKTARHFPTAPLPPAPPPPSSPSVFICRSVENVLSESTPHSSHTSSPLMLSIPQRDLIIYTCSKCFKCLLHCTALHCTAYILIMYNINMMH